MELIEQTIPKGPEQTHAIILRPYALRFLDDNTYELDYDAVIGDLFGVNESSYMVVEIVGRPKPGTTVVRVRKALYTVLDQAMAILYSVYRTALDVR